MLPTPVFWPGDFHGQCIPWGRKELDRTERLSLSHTYAHITHIVTLTDAHTYLHNVTTAQSTKL